VVVVVVVVMRWSVHCCGGRRGCFGLGLRAVSCGLLVHVLDGGVPAEGRAWRAIEGAKSGERRGGVVSGRMSSRRMRTRLGRACSHSGYAIVALRKSTAGAHTAMRAPLP
jgi:hypothetical protein